jgi:hypothetical protein
VGKADSSDCNRYGQEELTVSNCCFCGLAEIRERFNRTENGAIFDLGTLGQDASWIVGIAEPAGAPRILVAAEPVMVFSAYGSGPQNALRPAFFSVYAARS